MPDDQYNEFELLQNPIIVQALDQNQEHGVIVKRIVPDDAINPRHVTLRFTNGTDYTFDFDGAGKTYVQHLKLAISYLEERGIKTV